MGRRKIRILALLLCVTLSACGNRPAAETPAPNPEPASSGEAVSPAPSPAEPLLQTEEPDTPGESAPPDVPEAVKNGKILLYGETHGNQLHYERELALWAECYEKGMRDLVLETPCFTADYLNRWMKADGDEILDQLFRDYLGTLWDSPYHRTFFETIKETCPDTVFHGVDIGVDSDLGWRYVHLLESEGLQSDPRYVRARDCLSQGRTYSSKTIPLYAGAQYREECLAENFAAVFDALGGRDVMGIFGLFHVNGDELSRPTPEYVTMLDLLLDRYPGAIQVAAFPPVMETLTVAGREYRAEYGGATAAYQSGYMPRRYWKLPDAYEDFRDCLLTGNRTATLPFPAETGMVYVMERQTEGGSVSVHYFRTDGNRQDGYWLAEEFIPE